MVFGVIFILMDAIAEKVAGVVAGVAVHTVVVLRVAGIVARERGKKCVRAPHPKIVACGDRVHGERVV
jgi:hypothetical protein